MRPYQQELRPASFRGVPFFIDTADTELNRRVAIHEYPFRDTATAEDLGKQPLSFSIKAYIVTTNLEPQRTALFNACYETAGAGVLVHPTLGQKTVVCQGCSYSWNKTEGGYESFNLTFVEVDNAPSPVATIDTQATALLSAEALGQSSEATFMNAFSLANSTSNTVASALQNHSAWMGAFKTALSTLGTGLATVQKAIRTFELKLNSLLAEPKAYAKSVYGLYISVKNTIATEKIKVLFWRNFLSQLNQPKASAFVSAKASKNQQAMETLTASIGLVGLATALAKQDYTTYEEATQAQQNAIAVISQQESVLINTFQDETLAAVQTTKLALMTDLKERGQQLPVLSTVQLSDSTPAVVLAWDLYADANRADEIVTRNGIVHAGFLPTNTPLKVLELV
jgi:prophage DNA circulation protein